MRVLHVVEVTIGGVITVVNVFSRWQEEHGDEVHVLAPAGADTPTGTRHVWDPTRRAPHRFPAAVADLRQLVAELEPDVVHLHSFFPGVLGRLRADRSQRTALVYQPHSWAFSAAPTPFGSALVSWWERSAARRTDAVIVNCLDEEQEALHRRVRTPAHVVGMPIDTSHFTPATPDDRAGHRQRLGVDGRFVMLCVGRLARQKGQDRLVEAWCQNVPPDAVLVLLGDGDPAQLQAAAGAQWGRSIIAPGAVSDVRPWLAAADLMVAPSRWESQEVAVAEAMASGLPVVATEVAGAREAIEEGPEPTCGVVVGQHDLAAFLAACRLRQADRAGLDRESAAARARSLRLFAVDQVMDRVGQAYDDAIAARSRVRNREGAS